jgi:hypothetical protein
MKKRQNRKGEKQELTESAEQVREKIRKRAYEFFALRGKEDGSDSRRLAQSRVGSAR